MICKEIDFLSKKNGFEEFILASNNLYINN